MSLEQFSDEELVAGFRDNPASDYGRGCLDELFGRHHERVARWCYRFTGNRDAAADLAQEIFLNAYRYLDNFKGLSKFSTWLYTIARNKCLDAFKRDAQQPEDVEPETIHELPDLSQASALAVLERESMSKVANELLNGSLDDTEKRVFELHYGEGLALDVITRLLALENASGAKAYIVSAKRKLSRSVQRWKAKELGLSAGRGQTDAG